MGCGCVMVLLGTAFPRLVIVLLFIFSNWWGRAFNGFVIPVLGFIFLPYTLLWASVVTNWYGGEWGVLQIALLVVALILDFSPLSAKYLKRQESHS